MMGLFVLGLLIFWTSLAFWLGSIISKKFFPLKEGSENNGFSGIARYRLIRVFITVFLFFLPVLDQIIAYPKWQQLCATTGDFEWGPGMNEEKAFGRDLIVYGSIHRMTIFPNIHVTYFSRQLKDSQTGELILNMPHASYYKAEGMFYIPSGSGDKDAILLSGCTTMDKGEEVTSYLNKFNLKVIEYKN